MLALICESQHNLANGRTNLYELDPSLHMAAGELVKATLENLLAMQNEFGPRVALSWALRQEGSAVQTTPACALCEKTLTYDNISAKQPNYCFMCDEEEMKGVIDDYPEDAKEAVRNSVFGQGAVDALYLRIQANNSREAADDTDDAQMVRDCLKEAERLDAVATKLLHSKASFTFKPWWYERWDYFRVPGYKCPMPKSAPIVVSDPPVAEWPARRAQSEDLVQFWTSVWAEQKAAEQKAATAKAFWPSPRPKNFAKKLGAKVQSHQKALEFLAERVGIDVDTLLAMNPLQYEKDHMYPSVAPLNYYTRRSLKG